MADAEKKQKSKNLEEPSAAEGRVVRLSPGQPDTLAEPQYFLNRELSLLEFQRRVLEEARDERNPLLERVKFLAILFGNLDEFFMVRVAGLKQRQQAGMSERSHDGRTPAEQLALIRRTALDIMKEAQKCFRKDLHGELDRNGIHILPYDELSKNQKENARAYFKEIIYPVVTPLAHDPGRPFPHISNLSLNLAVLVRNGKKTRHFARIKVPESLPRLVPLKQSSGGFRKDGTVPENHYFVWIEQLITAHLEALFPGMDVDEVHPFHVTRDADIEIQELEAADLLASVEASIRKRRFGSVVRIVVGPEFKDWARDLLIEHMEVDPKDIYTLDGPLALNQLMPLHAIELPELKYPPFVPRTPAALADCEDIQIFDRIQRQDIMLHHPYDSFMPVVDFLCTAAEDPNVLAIKQTLYRVGPNSPVVAALLGACRNGKQVSALVELKARFDEQSNIEWVKQLEQEGVHVVYGLLGLKTHAKVALVVRKEGERIRRYVHLATGNYNQVTAHQYEDIGFFTADEALGEDASDLFNYLTGYSNKTDYKKMLVAPVQLRQHLESLIVGEIEHARQGRPAHMILKTNAITDTSIIKLLYEASRAGVKVDLIVRGICCIRPGMPKTSDNMRVVSVVGRFLEHSRVYYFHNLGEERIYVGSADLMTRNFDFRVEVLFPLESKSLVRYVRDEVLETYLKDNSSARVMLEDGSYRRLAPGSGEAALNVQKRLLGRDI